jgi:hypothetical protein
MSVTDQSHLQWHTVETYSKNEPCKLDRAAARHGLTIDIYGLSCSSCVSHLHTTVTLQSLWARHCALCAYSFVFCLLRVSLIEVYSPNCEFFVCWELFHHKIFAGT